MRRLHIGKQSNHYDCCISPLDLRKGAILGLGFILWKEDYKDFKSVKIHGGVFTRDDVLKYYNNELTYSIDSRSTAILFFLSK